MEGGEQRRVANRQLKQSGCYIFCLHKINGSCSDIEDVYSYGILKNWWSPDCVVKGFGLGYLTSPLVRIGKPFVSCVRSYPVDKPRFGSKAWFSLRDDQACIVKLHNDNTGYDHFCVAGIDDNNQLICLYDPLGDSVTRKEGYIEDVRIYTRGDITY